MTDVFARFYELFFYDVNYVQIFFVLYDTGGYAVLGLWFIVAPIVGLSVFYYILNNPYYKLKHWIISAFIISIIVGIISGIIYSNIIFGADPVKYSVLSQCMNDPSSGYFEFADSLIYKISFLNGLCALLLTFIYSLFLKRFSKIHMHLPI